MMIDFIKACILVGVLTLALTTLAKENKQVEVPVVVQKEIRPSYPFPSFISTGPYVWYENAENKPIKGHAYRIATFVDEESFNIFIEKINFGDGGCCLEIIDYRQLLLDEAFLNEHFPENSGRHGFKLIRWVSVNGFEFDAYGGQYSLTNLDTDKPLLTELIKE